MYGPDWLTVLIIAGAFLLTVLKAVQTDGEPEDPVEEAQQAYVQDEISLDELESRLAVAVDDRTQHLRSDLERVNGIGPDTSHAIASEFRTRWRVQQASVEDLTEVHGVGESTAEAVREHIGSTS